MTAALSRIDVGGLPFGRTLAAHVAAAAPKEPVVYQNSRVCTWPAMDRWGPEAFEDVGWLTRVYTRPRTSGPVFGPLWDPGRPLGQLSTVRPGNPHDTTKLTPAAFFSPSDQYHYYVDLLDAFSPERARREVVASEIRLEPEDPVFVWIGQAEVCAHLHWDTQPNLNAQIVGRKRFVLLPPEAWQVARPFPFLHPAMGQCQLDVFADGIPPGAREVVLEPGEVLYIPPMWFHAVQALELCINVNCFGHAAQTEVLARALEEIGAQEPPVDPRGLILDLVGPAFIKTLLATRFATLGGAGQLAAPRARAVGHEPFAREVARILAELPEVTRDIWVGHLIELVACHAAGPDGMTTFLQELAATG